MVAAVQEFGTKGYPGNSDSPIPTIRPKRSQFLTIPMPDALTPSGRPKGGKRLARQWDDTFVYQSPKGQLFIAQGEDGEAGDDLSLLFMLRRKVDLAPRLGMRQTFGRVTDRFMRRVDVATQGELAKAMGRR